MRNWILGALALVAPAAAQQVNTSTAASRSQAAPAVSCPSAVLDQATGNCVEVSTTPTTGMLLPLGPELHFDQFGQLKVGSTTIVNGAVVGTSLVGTSLGVNGGDALVYNGGRVGIGTIFPESDLHVSSVTDATILVESDWDNLGEFDHPEILFSQDGGLVKAFVGFQDGENDISIRNLYSSGGLRFDLHTSSTRDWEFRRRATSGLDVEARLTQSGNLQLDGSVSSPAADLAEFYPLEGPVEPGDVVAFTGRGLSLERAHAGVAGRLAGVISSRPAFVMGLSYTREDELGLQPEDPVTEEPFPAYPSELRVDPAIEHEIQVNRRAPLALSGRIPCKVTGENGPIRPGDLLTVSSLPGHAMKATSSGAVIGTALEDWQAGEGRILVLANLGWFSPSQDLERRVAELERQVERLLAR